MSNYDDALRAHDLLDELDARAELSQEQEKLLRSFLPERPKKVTLLGLCNRVQDAWLETGANQWYREGEYLDNFLLDLRDDLTRLLHEDAPPVHALPAGMRLAEHEKYGRVVVSPRANSFGDYSIFALYSGYATGAANEYVSQYTLTFIDAEPAHPEFLETEADYENAPLWTVIAMDGVATAWVKVPDMWIGTTGGGREFLDMSKNSPHRVLRWGDV